MATTTFQFEQSDFEAFARLHDAARKMSLSAREAASAFRDTAIQLDSMWATMPGERPDQFTLLNRYLRTGVKPEYLINE